MITVFGSINLDLVVEVFRLPQPGETVIGSDHQYFPGGKGANQAVAARRAGANVQMVGAVGVDAFADLALSTLVETGVDLTFVQRLETASTGLALIGVDTNGENQIIVSGGANQHVRGTWLENNLTESNVLLIQGELDPSEVKVAVQQAKIAGVRVIWNPAPVPDLDHLYLVRDVDVLVVNEGEANALSKGLGLPSDPQAFVEEMAGQDGLAIITRGADGVVAADSARLFRFAPPAISVVDTTGAGDAFCGALAAALDRSADAETALCEAVASGSLACTVLGAQSSSPTRLAIAQAAKEVRSF